MTDTSKPSNPKDAIGSDKLPLHLWPALASAEGSLALLDGALKYGRSNFRVAGVRASIYNDALRRHMDAWFEGRTATRKAACPTWRTRSRVSQSSWTPARQAS